jgi:PAS domain S-box-containing protein
MRRFRLDLLKTRLLAGFVFAAVMPVGAVGFLADRQGDATLRQQFFTHLSSVAELKGQQLEGWLRERHRDVVRPAASPNVRRLAVILTAGERHPQRQAADRELREILDRIRTLSGFAEMFLVEAREGLVVLSTDPEQEGKLKSDRPYFREGLKGPYFQHVYYSLPLGKAVMAFSAPIEGPRGRPIALLVGRVDLAYLDRLMAERPGLGRSGRTFLVNRFNYFVSESLGRGPHGWRPVFSEGVKRVLAGQTGTALYVNHERRAVVGAYRWLPELELGLVAEVDQDEAFAPVWRFRLALVAVLGLVGAVAIVLGVGFSYGISRPIGRLVAAVRAFGRGDLSHRVEIARPGELALLASAVNQMADDLSRSRRELETYSQTLERRVEERTAESEARRRAAEALAEVARSVAQSLDEEEVARRVADRIRGLLGAMGAGVFRLDPASQELVAVAISGELGQVPGQRLVFPPGTSMIGLAVREREPVTTQNLLADPRVGLTPDVRARIERAAYRAGLAVPLRVRGQVIGALGIGDREGRVFGPEEVQCAQSFADHAAVALENARLYREAREAHDFLKGIAESSPDGIVATDVHGRVTYFSAGAEALFGYRAEEVLGARVTDSYRGGLAEGRAIMARLRAEGRVVGYETAFRHRDGRWIETELSISTIRDATGALVGTLGVFRDVTERKRAAQRQATQFAATRALMESASLGEAMPRVLAALCLVGSWEIGEFWSVAPDGNALRWEGGWHAASLEASELEGVSRELRIAPGVGLAGRVWASGKPAWVTDVLAEIHPAQAPAAAALELKGALAFPIHGTAAVTGVLVFMSRTARDRDDELLAVMDDIASRIGQFIERMRAEAALEQSEEQVRQLQKLEGVGRLAGGIAHDFNNLLTVITGRAQILLPRLPPDGRLHRDVELIRKTAERAAALTKQLLAFSRRQILAPKVLDLNTVVPSMATMLQRLIGEDIELVFCPGSGLGRVKADPGQLEQVIANLVVNARDAMPEGGRITIETAEVELGEQYAREHVGVQPGRYVMLAVSDTGVGMDAATRARIFEPFFTTKEPGKGTGLGLSTVYGIVKQSGGSIWVYSEPGGGATFKIYLPRVEEVEDAVEAPPALPGRGTETILLAEDEDEVRVLAREILEGYGYTVLEARRPADAIVIAERYVGPIHLLATDVVMPEMSGRALAERLAPQRPEMKVLFVSGYTDNAIVHHGVLEPGTAFIQKPFTPEALARKVREVLDAEN